MPEVAPADPGAQPSRRPAWALAAAGAATAAAATLLAVELWRRRAARQRRRLAVHVASPYADAGLREALARLGLAEDPAAPCQWADFVRLGWEALLAEGGEGCRRSCLYLRAGLVRKGMLAHRLAKRKVSGVLPEGLVADVEDEEDAEDLRRRLEAREPGTPSEGAEACRQPRWVAKASCANRGELLFLARDAAEAVEALRPAALGQGVVEWVVQRYVTPPLLVRGRKFHVRAHLLAAHPEYNEERQTLLLEELDRELGRKGLAAQVQARMEHALAEALAAAASAPAGFAPLPQCFELFGADFTLEDRGHEEPGVWLLEVNAGPDLAVFGERLRPECSALLEDVLRVAVEPYLLEGGPRRSFADAQRCACGSLAGRHGFTRCLWSAPPRTCSAAEELAGFKRRVGIAGRWARALHEGSSVAVRGPQGFCGGSGPPGA